MTYRVALLALATAGLLLAGGAGARQLDSQRLPARVHPPIYCIPPRVARQVRSATGKLVWRCVKLRVL